MKENEIVFCLLRTDLEALFGTPLPQGRYMGPELERVFSLPQHFLRRGDAEYDPVYKQLIPYQLFIRQDHFFVYQRGDGVGEGRLASRLSVGIGGHISIEDTENGLMTPAAYLAALLRERQEELCGTNGLPINFIGWINDDSDSVGQVHLGAVHCCEIQAADDLRIRKQGEDIHALGWWSAAEIDRQKEKFEKWSLMAVGLASQASFSVGIGPP